MKKKRNYLLKVRRSRKSYSLMYFSALIIIGIMIYLLLKGYSLNWQIILAGILVVFFIVKFAEVHRLKDWWAISDSSVVQSLGIFSKNIRSVDFSSISDLDLTQSIHKRILNYGDVNLRLFLNETSLCVNNINNPEGFINFLEDTMSKKKQSSGASEKR